jgi:predicted  nucleic acid-binding Zn-ribbon protein
METEITPEQKGQLKTWAGQRDAILLEISGLQTAQEKLVTANKQIAEAYKDTEDRMNQVIGRIEELKKQEAQLPLLISKEIASLQAQKTCLESEIMNLAKLVEVLTTQKTSLENDVSSALQVFNTVKAETTILDQVVDHVTKVSTDNARDINLLVADLKKSLEEIVSVNRKNVFETNVVIEKLPAMLVEAQKRGIIKNKI